MEQRLTEQIRATLRKVIKGHYGLWLGVAAAGAVVALGVLSAAIVVPRLGSLAVLVSLGYLVAATLMIVALLTRSSGLLLDLSANVSLQSHLARTGFVDADFFVDGAAGSPTLQLLLTKILSLCKPETVLELGSGQTTKLLAHYARSRPAVTVLTIEEDSAWHSRLSAALQVPPNHQYRASGLEPREVVLPNNRGTVSTFWYREAESLLSGRRFQLILVDGPTNYRRGDEFVRYSRSGLIPHLPSILDDSFVIVIDDTDNYGYLLTARSMRESITARGRAVCAFDVHGVKSHTVLCSPDWQFLRSV